MSSLSCFFSSGHNSLFGSQILTGAGFILNNALASFDSSDSDKPVSASSSIDSGVLAGPQPSTSGAYLDSPHSVPGQGQPDYVINSSSHPSSESTPLQRSKRNEAGPRATVWGSSVANNGLAGGKRPISLATPIIAVERGQICGRRLILGVYLISFCTLIDIQNKTRGFLYIILSFQVGVMQVLQRKSFHNWWY